MAGLGKSWQVEEKVGRFAKIVGMLGKKLAGWGKSWQVGKSWEVAGFEVQS